MPLTLFLLANNIVVVKADLEVQYRWDNVTRYGGMRLSAVTGGKMENFRLKK